MTDNQQVEDIQLDIYQDGIQEDLGKISMEWDARVYQDKLAEGLDQLVQGNKDAHSGKFNRILFSHILDFKNLSKTGNSPILVSDFFHSYFLVYESMRRNRDFYGRHCLELNNKLAESKNSVQAEKQSEKVLENGQTNNSKVKIEIREINISPDLDSDDIDAVFEGRKLVFEYVEKGNNQTEGDSYVIKEIPLSAEGLNNGYQFVITDINKKIEINLYDYNGVKTNLDSFTPGESYDVVEEKFLEIPDKGSVHIDVAYINSNVNFINKMILQTEKEYDECHVDFDNLDNSIKLLEEPFNDFCYKLNQDPDRQLAEDCNPNNDPTNKKNTNYMNELHRKEIEMSEKVENMILNVSGKKCIVWDTIYYLFNKIMLGCVILVMTYRGDYATVR
jgi:hypothetical protein